MMDEVLGRSGTATEDDVDEDEPVGLSMQNQRLTHFLI